MNALEAPARHAIDAVWRIESGRLTGGLMRLVRDLGLAEDLAHEALVAALERWPVTGIPDNPGAWLMTVAKHRALDHLRGQQRREHSRELAALESPRSIELEPGSGDDLLRLILVACHPILTKESRVALTLRLLGGLTTEEIARASLVPTTTIAQRIVRAKRTLHEAKVPFEVPQGAELSVRLESVLEVIYVVFNEGYAATGGEDWTRPELCQDALRLGRVLAELVPREAEVHALVALMELHASRLRARVGPDGEPILLLEQKRASWDPLLIRRGLAALALAESLAEPLGPYALQAAISACHARARTAQETDWNRIVALYDALVELTGSPIVELNRAVAVSMAHGPAEGLELVEQLRDEPALRNYHLLHCVRGDLLSKLGRAEEARNEFQRAAGMTQNAPERKLLLTRARLA